MVTFQLANAILGRQSLGKPRRHLTSKWKVNDGDCVNLRMASNFFKNSFWGSSIKVKHSDSFAALVLPAYIHLSDVDGMLATNGADVAYQARNIFVGED